MLWRCRCSNVCVVLSTTHPSIDFRVVVALVSSFLTEIGGSIDLCPVVKCVLILLLLV